MAYTAFGGSAIPFYPLWNQVGTLAFSAPFLDGTNEGVQFVGRLQLPDGPGTSKTISAAGGGKIHWSNLSTSSTFANAGTNFRVGVQDVGADGLGDGTFDVYADFVGGGGGITLSGLNASTMTSGSKTIAHGDTVAVMLQFTARAGSDLLRPISFATNGMASPYAAIRTLASFNKDPNAHPFILIEFDDGTIGYFSDTSLPITDATQTFNSGSTPDEYALLFQVTMGMRVAALLVAISDIDAGDSGEVILYTDPLGTPSAAVTLAVGPENTGLDGTQSGPVIAVLSSAYDLSPSTDYAIAYRPTSTNNRGCSLITLPNAASRAGLPFGTSMQGGSRTNQSGAFGSLSSTTMLRAGLLASAIDISPVTSLSGVPMSRVFTGA